MEEIWKDIKNYEGIYQISNLGRLKSLSRVINSSHNSKRRIKECLVKSKKNPCNGYMQVCLHKNNKGKSFYVHRLVAQEFIDNPNGLPEINHKDENKENNCSYNLEWCSASYNRFYGTARIRAFLTMVKNGSFYNRKKVSKKVLCIDTEKFYPSVMEASRQTGFDNSGISRCCRGENKKCGGFRWKYV